jgi:hypothetical protein
MNASHAALAQKLAPLVLSLKETASTLSMLMSALLAALAQVSALLALLLRNNLHIVP